MCFGGQFELFSAISAYLCELCAKRLLGLQLTQRSQRYAEIAEKGSNCCATHFVNSNNCFALITGTVTVRGVFVGNYKSSLPFQLYLNYSVTLVIAVVEMGHDSPS